MSVERATGGVTTLHVPREEIGLPVGTFDGRFVAAVEACCSDRTIIAGDAIVFDRAGGGSRWVDTRGVNVTHLAVKDAATLIRRSSTPRPENVCAIHTERLRCTHYFRRRPSST